MHPSESRRTKALFYYADSTEIDLCDAEGREFVNTCWDLGNPETLERELRAMQFGSSRWPSAKGRLVYHEYQAQAVARFDNPMPAWKMLLGRFDD